MSVPCRCVSGYPHRPPHCIPNSILRGAAKSLPFRGTCLARPLLSGLLACGILLSAVAPIRAQEAGWVPVTARTKPDKAGEWDATFGVMTYGESEYHGSDKYAGNAWPWIEVTWRDRVYFSSERGVGLNFLATERWVAGAGLDYYMGRGDDESDYLRNMGDISPGLEGKLFAEARFGNLTLGAEFRQDLMGADDGALLTGTIAVDFEVFDDARLSLGLDGTVMSENYAQTYYGVDSLQAARTGYNTYTPEAGIRDIGASMKGEYFFNEHWGLMAYGRYAMLGDPVTSSPLNKTDSYIEAGFGAGYRF